MRLRLLTFAVLSMTTTVPTMAADWTGFYAGFYAGASARNDEALKGAIVYGEFGEDGNVWPPSAVNNVGGIDPLIFDLLSEALEFVDSVPSADAVGLLGTAEIGHAPGVTVGAVGGYSFGNGFRVESDVSRSGFVATSLAFIGASAHDIDGGFTGTEWNWTLVDSEDYPVDGAPPFDLANADLRSSAIFLLGNAWYDFDNDTAVTPYVGGGLGVANVTSVQLVPGGDPATSSGWSPAGQLGAGLTVDLDETAFIDIGYRLKAAASAATTASDVQYVGNGQFAGIGLATGGPIIVQTLQVGLNFKVK